jgi:transposase
MIVAFIDIHKHVFQASRLDPATGEVWDDRFPARSDALEEWAERWQGQLGTVAIEATNGWRWVCRLLQARGVEVRLVDPGQARALQGRRRRAKTDRLDARWGVLLLAKELLPEAWLPPEEIQQLRDQTRLRQALVRDRTAWAQRLHAFLAHEGFPVSRGRLLTGEGRRWLGELALGPHPRRQVDTILAVIEALERQIDELERELRRFARNDPRTRALARLRGIGEILACILVAEIGDVRRFHRARQITRAAGLDPVVSESADSRRRGRLAKAGSPQLRFALVEAATWAGRGPKSPDHDLYQQVRARAGAQRAQLTVARKIGRRVYHVLHQLEHAA